MKTRKNAFVYYSIKFLVFIVSVLLLSVTVFSISRLTPSDPLVSYYGDRLEKMTTDEKAIAREKLGLCEDIHIQYFRWLKNAVKGDFGISYKYKQDVIGVIIPRIPNTLILGITSFILIFVFSLLIGIFCAIFEGSFIDRLICRLGTFLSCIPEFWLSLLLIFVFCVCLKWLPSSGAYTIGKEQDIFNRILHLILPITVVITGHLWYYAYIVRNKTIEEFSSDYVLLAKSYGVSNCKLVFSHVLRNILPSYISIMAISVPHIIGGTYIVEAVFSYPGLGTLAFESAKFSDYNMLMVLCMMTGVCVIFFNMLGQIISDKLDPRLRIAHTGVCTEVTEYDR